MDSLRPPHAACGWQGDGARLDASEEALAARAGASRVYIAKLETAKQEPTLGVIEKLAKADALGFIWRLDPPKTTGQLLASEWGE